MTATIPEISATTIPVNTTTNISVTTTLVSSDVVVVVYSRGDTSSVTVSGLGGATFTNIFTLTNNASRVVATYTTGRTGTGTISVNNASATAAGRAVVYVVRGLNSVTVTEAHSVWDTNFTSNNTDEFTGSQSFGVDQVAIIAGNVEAGTATFPSNPTPSSGWTNDDAHTSAVRLYTAHMIGTSAGTVRTGIRSTSFTYIGAACIVLGTPTGGGPLVSTFVGWGNPIF